MKVAIIGGGISGIGAAETLVKNNINFTLFEKNNVLGGLVIT